MKRAVAQDAAHLTVFEYVGAVMGTPNPSYSPYQGFSGDRSKVTFVGH